jgi:DNA-binding SARP family transcriptional activator
MVPDFPRVLLGVASPPAPMLHLFGEPSVSVAGHAVEVPRGCHRLLVFAALRRCRVDRTHAAGTLWPVNDEARAGANLRSALWRLNRMEVRLLSIDKHGFAIRDDVVVDVHLVSAWATRVIQGAATTVELRVVPRSLDALELLPGWYDDWAMIERERVRQWLLHALEAQSRQLARLRLHAEAVDAAMVAVAVEPLRQSAQCVLIEAHLAAGNWVEAKRSLDVYAGLLDRELGVRPDASLTALLHRTPAPAV